MCGITGFLQQNENSISLKDLKRMGRTLHHRGPDDEGYFLINTHNSAAKFEQPNGNIGLAQQRLSIIDVSPMGHQPMPNNDKSIWVNFNGEIYNFQEIRKELVAKGYKFRGHSDTEVIVYAFEEWGIDCIEWFNGMFAISIWDNRDKKLYLVRDRLGIKPLYYYNKNGNFAFGSELKAIMQYPYFEKELDFNGLWYYFLFQYIPAPYSIFKNTYKLLPGRYLVIPKNGEIKEYTYWDSADRFKALNGSLGEKSEEELLNELDNLLTSSVRYRMISDVPLGLFLSGGIDSSLVTAVAQKVSKKPIKTFSIGFAEKELDEAPYAREIAKHLGTEHHELHVSPKLAQNIVPKLPLIYDEPFADPSGIPTHIVSQLARKHVTVALSGDGGDELFGGYNRYEWVKKMVQYNSPYWVRKGAAGIINAIPERGMEWVHHLAKPFLPEAIKNVKLGGKKKRIAEILKYKDLIDFYFMLIRIWSKAELNRLMKKGDDNGISHLPFYGTGNVLQEANPILKVMLIDLNSYLVDDILTKVDRASMAVSLENRVPILDHHIVEFTFGLPLEYKNQKYLLKKLLSKYVPPGLYERPKHGFGVPMAKWLRNDMKYLLDDYLSSERLKKEGLFNIEIVKQTIEEHLSCKKDHWHKLWTLISFEMWKEQYGK